MGPRAIGAMGALQASGPEPAGGYCTVLDGGSGAVKALIVDLTTDRPLVSGGAVQSLPPACATGTAGDAGFETLVAAAEEALRVAEDAAGVVPRQAVLGVGGVTPALSYGQGAVRRRRPGAPLQAGELSQAVAHASEAALSAAAREARAEWVAPVALEVVQVTLHRLRLDGQDGHGAAGLLGATGAELEVEVVAGIAAVAEVQRQRRLAEALDLHVVGLVSLPLALAAVMPGGGEGAVLIDAGARSTTVIVTGAPGTIRGAVIPLGSADLESRAAAALGMHALQAQEALRAHTAGALRPGAGNQARAAGRQEVHRLAEQHAELWADAVELSLAGLAQARPVPGEVWLCGGGATLPELRLALGRGGWGLTLSWTRPVTVRLLAAADIGGIEDWAPALPALQGVPPLAIAAAARRA